MVQLLTRRVGTLLSRLIATRTTAEGLPLRGTRLTLPLAVAVVALHHPVVGMTLIVHLLGKSFLHLITPSPESFPGIILPVPCPLGLMIILPPERIIPTDRPILVIGTPILQVLDQ